VLRDAFFQQIFERLCQKNIDLSQVFVFGSQHRPWLTSAMTSDTTVAHLADSASGPSACPRNREIHASKVQKWFRGAFFRFGRLLKIRSPSTRNSKRVYRVDSMLWFTRKLQPRPQHASLDIPPRLPSHTRRSTPGILDVDRQGCGPKGVAGTRGCRDQDCSLCF
jgi:hypothetical protein